MLRSFVFLTLLVCLTATSSLFAACGCDSCCQSVDVSVGWRQDNLKWKMKHLDSSDISGHANSRILFKGVNSYTISGEAKWAGPAYYIRLSGEYGTTANGRAKERFKINSPYLYHPIDVDTSNRVKRRSEVYDFDGAVGYPFSFFCCRLSVIPLIGFSFHRQHLRVKEKRHSSFSSSSSSSSSVSSSSSSDYSSSSDSHHSHSSSYSYYYPSSLSDFFSHHSSSDFYVSSSNHFVSSPYLNPFSSSSSSTIASALGLKNPHRTSNYRFTWYGFYLGTDIAYALDSNWTLFSELEIHFDNCHRKRKSWTGVNFVDRHHKQGWAYGFNGVVGLTYDIAACWYATAAVDFKWWTTDSHRDRLEWKNVGAKIGLGYMF
jgi:hypothetical protein